MSNNVCYILIAITWAVSSLVSLPNFVYQKVTSVETNDGKSVYVCHDAWPSTQSQRVFSLATFVMQYVIPCVIIAFCYTKVRSQYSATLYALLYFRLKNV